MWSDMLSDISDIYANFVKIKNPDSSPASDIRERNYRDCDAKLVIISHITKHFSIKFFLGLDSVLSSPTALCSGKESKGLDTKKPQNYLIVCGFFALQSELRR